MRFSIYDTENLTSKDLHKHQLIGSVNIQLIRLLENAQNNGNGEHHERCYDLIYQENAKKRGKIIIDAEELDQSSVNTNVKVCLSAIKLSKKGLNIFGKCDAYFELERKLHNEVFHPVYRSEVVFRNSEPRQVVLRCIQITTIELVVAIHEVAPNALIIVSINAALAVS